MQNKTRRNAESNFITLLNFIVDPAVIVDEKGLFLVVNDAFTELTGLKKKELIGTTFFDLSILSAENKAILFANLAKRMKGEQVEPYEIGFENRSGETRYAEVKAKRIDYSMRSADLVVFRDITRRKRNAKRLKEYSEKMAALVDEKAREIKESKEKIEKIFNASPDAIVATDLEGRLVEVNEAAVHMYGYSSKDELIGKSTFDLVPEKERQNLLLIMETLSEDGTVKNVEHVSLTKQNRIFPVEFSASVIKDSSGKSIGFMGVIKDISERKKAEEALRLSEEKYRELINRMNETVWVIDLDAKFIDVNDAAVKVLGYSREELLSMGPADIDSSLSKEQILHLVRNMPADQTQVFETSHTTKSGKTIPVEISSSLVTYQGKQAILSIARDISERKKAEAKILASERKYRKLFKELKLTGKELLHERNKIQNYLDIAEVMFVALDVKGRITMLNRKGCEILKCTAEEALGKDWFSTFLPEKNREKVKDYFNLIISGNASFPKYYEHPVLAKNGETRLIGWYNTTLTDDKGRIIGTLSSAEDITEWKKAQQALVDSEEKFRSIVENSGDVVMLTLPDGTVSYMSPACYSVLGYTPEDLVGKQPSIFHPDDLQLVNKTLMRALKGEKGSEFEYRVVTKDGETRWVSHSWSPILENGKVKLIVSIVRNITERKKAEAELSESEDKYRTLVEQSLQGVLIGQFTPFRFVFANQPTVKILGYTVNELTSLSPEEIKGLIHPADLSFVLKRFRKGLLGKRVAQRFEFRMMKKSGKVCWVEAFCSLTAYAGEPAVQAIFVDITERKNLEISLRTSEEMFRAISTSAMDAIILLDDRGKIMYWNPAAERIFSYTNEEALGKKLDNLILPKQYRGLHSGSAVNAFENGHVHQPIETKALTKNGTEVSVELSAAVLEIKGKKHALGIVRDITERKKMETTLREAEQRYHALFDKAPLGILVCDQTATAIEFNEEAHRQLGYTREEFAKLTVSDYEVIETPEETRARMNKIMREGKDEFETKHRTKNGEIRDVIVTVQLIELGGKKLFHLITKDVTEQKKTERDLEIEKENLEAVTENIGAGLAIISKDYRIIWANKLMKQINGECEGKTCYSTFNKLTDVCPNCGVKKVFDNGVPVDIHEYSTVDDKGNRLWIELIVTPIKDEKGNVTSALELAVNVTERKIMENKLAEYSQKLEKLVEKRTGQLKQTQAKLVKSERLATIGELAAMVGHDLRNPLTGIVGAAYYLKTKHSPELGPKGKEMLETIENAITYSNKIVNDLLEYSRDLKLELEESTPKIMLKNALSLLKVPEKIKIVDATEDKPTVKADIEKMRRVFVNLIKNAFDAMPEGGTLTVKSREVKGKLEIAFKDTGTGMSKETLSKLEGGVPLFTTKAKGMGFGVPICKRIAEAHGGNLSLESKVGKGTTVTITVPVDPQPLDKSEEKWIFNESILQTITAKQKPKQTTK